MDEFTEKWVQPFYLKGLLKSDVYELRTALAEVDTSIVDRLLSTLNWRERTTYYVIFETQGSERNELHVDGACYGQLVEQDQGMLKVQGTHYLGFQRERSLP